MQKLNWVQRRLLNYLVLLCLGICSTGIIHALDPGRAISKYHYSQWNTSDGLPSNWIYSIEGTKGGKIRFYSKSGIIQFESAGYRILDVIDGTKNRLFHNRFKDRQGVRWFNVDAKKKKLIENKFSLLSFDALPDLRIYAFIRARDGSYWLGSNHGLIWIQGERVSRLSTTEGLSNPIILTVIQDSDGNIWAGSFSGLNRIQFRNTGRILIDVYLNEQSINDLFEDRKRSIWVATKASGIYRISDCSIVSYGTEDQLPSMVFSLYQAPSGAVWTGSKAGGIHRYNGQRFDSFRPDLFKQSEVETIYGGLTEDIVWIGTRTNGLYRIKKNEVKNYSTGSGLGHNWVLTLLNDNRGHLWIGTIGGLYCLDEDKITTIPLNGKRKETVFCIMEDSDKKIWVSTRSAVFVSDPAGSPDFTAYPGINDHQHPVINLFQDSSRRLWFLKLKAGILLKKEGMTRRLTVENGLPASTIFTVVEDCSGDFWFSCQNGIFSLAKNVLDDFLSGRRGSISGRLFGIDDGMESVLCTKNRDSVLKTRDGKIWFGTFKGISVIDPNRLKRPVSQFSRIARGESLNPVWFVLLVLFFVFTTVVYFRKRTKPKRNKKYQSSSLGKDRSKLLLQKLMFQLEEEKIFTDENISLQRLADKLDIPPYQLSQLINEQLNKNFFDLINSSRIEEAKKMLQSDQTREQKMIHIAFDVGFRTETSFYKAFKKHTNMTPSEYKRQFTSASR